MIEKIHSKLEDRRHLHTIFRGFKSPSDRIDLSDDNEGLQVSCLQLEKNKSFPAHFHLSGIKMHDITQEAWVVISGSVLVTYYDLNHERLTETILYPGDCSITYYGGHSYSCLEDRTLVFEFKTGPYEGREKDKELINGK